MIRVMVVDDEALVRSGFEMLLNVAEDIEVVATAGGGQAMAAVAEHAPDLVLLDVRMPDVDGLTLLDRLMKLPRPPVVAMLTTFDSDEYIAAALRAGASGFLVKDTDPDELAPLVRSLAAGGVVLAPKVTSTVISGYLRHHSTAHADAEVAGRLTDRERDVLVLLAEGLSNADVSRRLHLSVGTVKDHVSAVLAKLEVANRVQAALWAQSAGLLDRGRQ
ncbi:response regulator transcription factor [Streptomyces sp. NBC_01565]|uniref:response regulator n=1 Tax=unclassified Streptomyces TaxID=2593676 RepID=UPI0022528A88|nr:response regulator transcription factor [Streptomyces sp. NBC_01565]MCX4546284.1 response regulator transcription factor [Streptomyces sp. NBC_01565]